MSTRLSPEQVLFLRQYVSGTVLGIIGATLVAYGLTSFLVTHRKRNSDRPLFKAIAAILLCLTTAHVLAMLADAGVCFTKHFNDFEAASATTVAYSTMEALNGVIASVVLSFYTWRCWQLYNKSFLVAGGLSICVLAVFAAGIYDAVRLYLIDDESVRGLFISSLSYVFPCLTDVIIVVLMLNTLFQARSRGMQSSAGKLIFRLVTLTVTTNGLTTAVNCVAMICYFLGNGGDVVLDPLVAHCYSITFLVWLNARRSAGGANSIDTPTKRSRSQAHSQIRIRQVQERHVDTEDYESDSLGKRRTTFSLPSTNKRDSLHVALPFGDAVPIQDSDGQQSPTSATDERISPKPDAL